jgi:hypothetical protein
MIMITKKTIQMVLGIFFIYVLFAFFGMEAKAQMPKEGITSFTSVYSGTFKILAMGQERVQMTYEFMGASIGNTPNDFNHNSSFRCIGAFQAVKGEYNDGSAFCVATRPDGDKIFSTYKTTGKLGSGYKGTYTLVGGTGKMAGIQGNGEFTGSDLRPAAEGSFQGYTIQKGQYKLP